MLLRGILCAVLVAGASFAAAAHEVRPAYLELRPTGPAIWSVLWKVPALGQSLRLRIDAQLPEGCTALGPRSAAFVGDAHVERWSVRCPTGLAGGTIRIEGLAALRNEALLRIEGVGGRAGVTARLTPAEPRFFVPADPSQTEILGIYLWLGVHHILLGADHLLFVLSLLLVIRGWRRLAATITAFTLGHTVTLVAATLGGLDLPARPVEAAIALSIACTAAEALRIRLGEPSLMLRAPWTVALFFGLLHGLGFAGALREIGLPEDAVFSALLFFNTGVEIGQLLFVGLVLGIGSTLGWLAEGAGDRSPATAFLPRSQRVACYAVGVTAAFWLIVRVQGLGS